MLLKRPLLKSLTSWDQESLWDGETHLISHIQLIFFVWSFSNQCTQAVAHQSSFCAHYSRLISYVKILPEHSETPYVDFRASFYFVLKEVFSGNSREFSGNWRDLSILNSKTVSSTPPQEKKNYNSIFQLVTLISSKCKLKRTQLPNHAKLFSASKY